jgi:hypothetical protein
MSEKMIFIIWNIVISIFFIVSFIIDKFQPYAISLIIVTIGANFSLLKKTRAKIIPIPLRIIIPLIIINILVLGVFAVTYIFKKDYLIIASLVVVATGFLSLLFIYRLKNRGNS